MTEAELARISSVLSSEARVRIVAILKKHGALCVGALCARMGITQGAVSQHLRLLRDADLVIPEKRGYYVHYRLNEKTLAKWQEVLNRFLSPARSGQAGDAKGCHQKGDTPCVAAKRNARNPKT